MEGERQRGHLTAQLPMHTCPGTRVHTRTCMHTQTPLCPQTVRNGVWTTREMPWGAALCWQPC